MTTTAHPANVHLGKASGAPDAGGITLTSIQLAEALAINQALADRLHPVAVALVAQYSASPPESIANEAVIRVSGWLAEQPAAAVRSEGVGDISTSWAPSMMSALRNSGAMALLSPWKVRRAGAIG